MRGSDSEQWWVFDRPLLRDPLFLLGTALGVATIALTGGRGDNYGFAALVLGVGLAVPYWLWVVAVVLGSVRAHVRAQRRAT